MEKKMGIEGVGPKLMVTGALSLVLAYFIERVNPAVFRFTSDPGQIHWLAVLLLGIGVVFWLGSVIQLVAGWRKKQLITKWFYGIILNPIYDSFAFFLIPAISLYINSWIYLLASVVLLAAIHKFSKEEEAYLRQTFGTEYEDYRNRVLIKL